MEELSKLVSGFGQFRKRYYDDAPELYKQLIEKGQSPKVLVIACCDSRVHPAQVMDTEPGDIFVIRNVANVVPPCEDNGKSDATSAAIEYAVKHLKVEHIIIFGHAQCGGIKSLMEGIHKDQKHNFIDPWMSIVATARDKILNELPSSTFEEQCRACEKEAIQVSMDNLMTFPRIEQLVHTNDLTLHGWYFDIEQGILFERNQSENSYDPIS